MKLTQNFSLHEFNCKDGTPVPEQFYPNVKELANNLQIIRDFIERPLLISGSGYRTKQHNEKVGGAFNSQHLTASAADISAKGYTSKELANMIEELIKTGKVKQGGLGIYPSFVHYDIRGKKARW